MVRYSLEDLVEKAELVVDDRKLLLCLMEVQCAIAMWRGETCPSLQIGKLKKGERERFSRTMVNGGVLAINEGVMKIGEFEAEFDLGKVYLEMIGKRKVGVVVGGRRNEEIVVEFAEKSDLDAFCQKVEEIQKEMIEDMFGNLLI
jgi:hypothetical protein